MFQFYILYTVQLHEYDRIIQKFLRYIHVKWLYVNAMVI